MSDLDSSDDEWLAKQQVMIPTPLRRACSEAGCTSHCCLSCCGDVVRPPPLPLRLKVRLLALSSTQAARPHRRRSSPPPNPRTPCRNSPTSKPPFPWQCHSLQDVVAPPQRTGSPKVLRITPGTKSPRGLTRCPHSPGLTRAFGDALDATTFASRALPHEDPPHRVPPPPPPDALRRDWGCTPRLGQRSLPHCLSLPLLMLCFLLYWERERMACAWRMV